MNDKQKKDILRWKKFLEKQLQETLKDYKKNKNNDGIFGDMYLVAFKQDTSTTWVILDRVNSLLVNFDLQTYRLIKEMLYRVKNND